MATNSEIYSDNFVYRDPVEPTQEYIIPVALVYGSVEPTGRIMSSLAGSGGLAGMGGIAGIGGGLAG